MSGETEATKCPKCGGEIHIGYGLAGGGIGPYRYCWTEGCDFFDKTQDDDEARLLQEDGKR